MNQSLQQAVGRLRDSLQADYREGFRVLRIFGSYARGDADDESDLDVLIVLDRIDNYAAEVDRTSEIIGELSLRCGISISRVFVSEHEWLHGDSVFIQNVREEAILV